jgi:hypothetical protein
MKISPNPLLRVCGLLDEHKAEYIVAGAWALILNSIVRATEDVDILIADHRENFEKVIAALSELEDGAAAQLEPSDFEENVVIKVADEVEVDVCTKAWKVTYAEAIKNACVVEIEGIKIPYLCIPDLIRSKETYRDQDRADVERLKRLL